MLIPTAITQQADPNTDGWVNDINNTWTYVSASTFTVSGDRTIVFSKGTRLRWTQTTVKYGVVVDSSYSAPNTTVTIAVNNDYTLANAAITNNYYSYAANPQGYPDFFNYTPTFGGFSGTPVLNAVRFSVLGKLCCYLIFPDPTTSNATSLTFTVPIISSNSASTQTFVGARVVNNGTASASPGYMELPASSSTAAAYRDGTGTLWTASGTKMWAARFFYEI